jgi:hypothetical protein
MINIIFVPTIFPILFPTIRSLIIAFAIIAGLWFIQNLKMKLKYLMTNNFIINNIIVIIAEAIIQIFILITSFHLGRYNNSVCFGIFSIIFITALSNLIWHGLVMLDDYCNYLAQHTPINIPNPPNIPIPPINIPVFQIPVDDRAE